jgi:hypothetical protein
VGGDGGPGEAQRVGDLLLAREGVRHDGVQHRAFLLAEFWRSHANVPVDRDKDNNNRPCQQ